jgi:hypothetical protein
MTPEERKTELRLGELARQVDADICELKKLGEDIRAIRADVASIYRMLAARIP